LELVTVKSIARVNLTVNITKCEINNDLG